MKNKSRDTNINDCKEWKKRKVQWYQNCCTAVAYDQTCVIAGEQEFFLFLAAEHSRHELDDNRTGRVDF